MKQFIFVISFVTLLFINLQAQWQVLNEWIGSGLDDIQFVNDDVGWMTGFPNTLLKTEDGGESWIPIQMNQDWIWPRIKFFNDSLGLAGIHSISEEKEYLIKSENGGDSWIILSQLPGSDFHNQGLIFITDSVFFRIGTDTYDYDQIYKTLNGGKTWNNISPDIEIISYSSVEFINDQIGIVVGKNSSDQQFISRTVNGGENWNVIATNFGDDIEDLKFINDSTGYFIVNTSFYETRDTCNSWSLKHTFDNISSYGFLFTDTIYSIVGRKNTNITDIMVSTDEGTSWEKVQRLGSNRWFYNPVYFTGNNTGYITANISGFFGPEGSIVMKSSEKGKDWHITFFSYPVTSSYFINEKIGFITGGKCNQHSQFGDIFRTTDGGKTWNVIFNYDCNINSCLFVNDDIGYALIDESIYKTYDKGNNWAEIYRDTNIVGGFSGSDLGFIDEKTVWVVGAYSNDNERGAGAGILATTDGGNKWDLIWEMIDPITDDDIYYGLNSIYIIDTTLWTAGESGLIVKSIGSNSFTIINSNTDLPLNDIFFSDEKHGWVAGGYNNLDQGGDFQSVVLKTSNGGESWQKIKFDKYLINDTYFADSLHGLAVGNDTSKYTSGFNTRYSGMILETEDGGENWLPVIEGLSAPLNAIFFRNRIGFAVGENGLVLRTDNWTTWVNPGTGEIYPNAFKLYQNYPNPFNPTTKINYSVSQKVYVTLKVYDILGSEIATLVNEEKPVGKYEIEFSAEGGSASGNAYNLSSGVYFYQLQAGNFVQTKKMVLLR